MIARLAPKFFFSLIPPAELGDLIKKGLVLGRWMVSEWIEGLS